MELAQEINITERQIDKHHKRIFDMEASNTYVLGISIDLKNWTKYTIQVYFLQIKTNHWFPFFHKFYKKLLNP